MLSGVGIRLEKGFMHTQVGAQKFQVSIQFSIHFLWCVGIKEYFILTSVLMRVLAMCRLIILEKKQFLAKKGIVEVPWRKEFRDQYCPRNLHVNGRQEFMKITADLGITNRDTISFSLIYRATMTDFYSLESTFWSLTSMRADGF